jgi:hypothetical protein
MAFMALLPPVLLLTEMGEVQSWATQAIDDFLRISTVRLASSAAPSRVASHTKRSGVTKMFYICSCNVMGCRVWELVG